LNKSVGFMSNDNNNNRKKKKKKKNEDDKKVEDRLKKSINNTEGSSSESKSQTRSPAFTNADGAEEKKDEIEHDSCEKPLVGNMASWEPQKEMEEELPPSSVPIVSLSHGLRNKESILLLQSWTALVLTLDGRDKATKLLQYTTRLLAWWWKGTSNRNNNKVKRCLALKASLTISRKAFRLGRSFIEFHKLQNMVLFRTLAWYLKRQLFFPTAAINPVENLSQPTGEEEEEIPSTTPLWKIIGTAIKTIGLLGFWAGDNISFVASSGALDNFQLESSEQRLAQRKALQAKASAFANRAYFAGALSGLMVSLRSYLSFRTDIMQPLIQQVHRCTVRNNVTAATDPNNNGDDDSDEMKENKLLLDKAKEKQFVLFLALVKSCADVMVFSNNPGIDLWKKHYGRNMHEGFHCLCGLVSASTVLYNKFPNVSKKE